MTVFDRAQRFVGISELGGAQHHPLIQWWHSLCGLGMDTSDETPWCSAFLNGVAWDLGLPRSRSAAARSWLTVGAPVPLDQAKPSASDIVILKRGTNHGPEVTSGAPGHVGVFCGVEGDRVWVLGGNQGNRVSVASFPVADVIGIRRIG